MFKKIVQLLVAVIAFGSITKPVSVLATESIDSPDSSEEAVIACAFIAVGALGFILGYITASAASSGKPLKLQINKPLFDKGRRLPPPMPRKPILNSAAFDRQ